MGWDGADYVQVLPLEKRNALRWRSRRLREADVVGAGRWWPPAYPESQIPHRGARYTVRILSPYRPLLLLIINLDATKVPNYLRCSHLHVGAAIAHMLHLKPFMRRSPSRVLLVVVNIEAAVNRIIMLDMQGLSYSYFCTLSTRPPPPFWCFMLWMQRILQVICGAVTRMHVGSFNEKEAAEQSSI